MGMAASQARFLNLTARKTNIEYQGQQINQQRTELSNKSATLYNQMLTLQVPTPPNTQDFTKVSYTFMMPGGIDEATVSQFTPISGTDSYSVSFSYKTTNIEFAACTDNEKPAVTNHLVKNEDNKDCYQITLSNGKSYMLTEYSDLTDDEKKIHSDANTTLTAKSGFGDLYVVNVGTESAPKYQYYSGSELAKCIGNARTQTVATYYESTNVETYVQDTYTPCTLTRDAYNRVQSFTHNPTGGTSTTFAVTTNTITDDDAYEDAMNEYTYKSYLYEQEMANINAQTSVIQAQDKELELQLKQLDTEHNAVQTEIESVSSVCKKNVEDSFKTFA